MTSLVQTPVKFMSGSVTPMRKRLSSSPECSMSESRETRLRRSLLHLPVVLHARSHIDLLWNLSLALGPKTLTTNSRASPFVGLPNCPPTSLARAHNRSLSPSTETRKRLPPLPGPISVTKDNAIGTGSPRVPSQLAPFTRKARGAEVGRAKNRKDHLPVGGKLAHYQAHWTKLFPQHPEIVRKVSQGILIAFDDAPHHFFVTRWSCQATTKQPTSYTLYRSFRFPRL